MKKAPVLYIENITVPTLDLAANVQVKVKAFINVVGVRAKIKYDPKMLYLKSSPVLNVQGALASMNITQPGEIVIAWLLWPGNYAKQKNGKPFNDGDTMLTIPFACLKRGTSRVEFLDDQAGNACSFRIDILGADGKPLIDPVTKRPLTNQITDDTPFAEHYFPGEVTALK